ncbi:MAG: Site-specific recombinase Xer protein [Chlorobi bacterium OLB7]|nr:MAG: Site-specific recombinase Xer protein [Chlorobi bacterium OLB7]
MPQPIPFHQAVRQFLEYLELQQRYSPKTIEAYQSDLERFAEHLRNVLGVDIPMLGDVTQREVRGFIAALHKAGQSRRTIGRRLAALKSFTKFCRQMELIEANPTALVVAPRPEKRLPTVLSSNEAEHLMESPDTTTPSGKRDAAILEMFYSTGLRRAELCGIRLRDVDHANNTVKVLGKGGKERIVPFGGRATQVLREYLGVRSELATAESPDALFLTNRGNPFDGGGIYRVVRRYMKGVTEQKKKSPHVLRHTFATHLLDAGAGIREVGELLGHSSLSSTQIYTHVTIERLKNAYNLATHAPPTTETMARRRTNRNRNATPLPV